MVVAASLGNVWAFKAMKNPHLVPVLFLYVNAQILELYLLRYNNNVRVTIDMGVYIFGRAV